MTNLEIDRNLALAIGWKPEQMRLSYAGFWQVRHTLGWMTFCHLEEHVIWPIAARYNCFPTFTIYNDWYSEIRCKDGRGAWETLADARSDNPATVVALCVIKASS